MGIYYNPVVVFSPNVNYSSKTIQGPIEMAVLPDKYQFTQYDPE